MGKTGHPSVKTILKVKLGHISKIIFYGLKI